MPIVSQPRWRDLSSWGVWLIDALVVVLLPRRTLPIASYSQPTLLPAAAQPAYAERSELWQSPYDPFPWFSRRLGARWQYAWFQVHRWLVAVRAWLMLAARLWNCRTLAEVIAELTRRCIARYLGALHVLHLLLEQLQVRSVINRCCRTESPVDHGSVADMLALNRLVAPRALYRVMDWLASTVLSDYLGVPAIKFSDDRLGRTLDALAEHAQAVWQDIGSQACLSSCYGTRTRQTQPC